MQQRQRVVHAVVLRGVGQNQVPLVVGVPGGARLGRPAAAAAACALVFQSLGAGPYFAVFQGTLNGGQRSSSRMTRVNRRSDFPYLRTVVQYGDLTVYYSRIGDRHLRYPGNLKYTGSLIVCL